MRRTVAVGVGCAGLASGAVAVATSRIDVADTALVAIASFAPFLLLGTVIGAAAFALTRRWLPMLLSVVVIVVGSLPVVPLYVPAAAARADGPSLTVLQANLMLGRADPDALIDVVREREIDVMTVQELTDDAVAALDAAGVAEYLPYRFTAPYVGGAGAGIYSRFPLSEGRELDGFLLANVVADVDVGGTEPVRVFGVHPIPPYPNSRDWGRELTLLTEATTDAAEGRSGAVVVSGDFNSTHTHARFRRVTDRFADAADAVGAGILPTYPTDKWYPPVVGIDHVLARGAEFTAVDVIDVVGSDHRGLVARMSLHR